jgi:gliding motility-associated-like protein
VNDVFQTYGENIDPATYELYVFDRWGNLIYFTRDMARGWNGSVNNSGPLCQIDTYVWRVSFRDTKGDPHEFVKHVNLIR